MTQTINERYIDVAKEVGLNETDTLAFLYYMNARWRDSERVKCITGYAKEWAERFRAGVAYSASDSIGKAILDERV